MTKAYLITASEDHAKAAVKGGFIQAGHGKKSSVEKLEAGDGIVVYSPTKEFGGKEKCQKITAVGVVRSGDIYQAEQSREFKPYRAKVRYDSIRSQEFREFLDTLSFVKKKKSWGIYVRGSIREIPVKDFDAIRESVKK